MRVNVYAEEMTDRVEIISKEIDGKRFTGLRFYLELPATVDGKQYQGPFQHRPDDDDSAAVTFWGKQDLRNVLQLAATALERHYAGRPRDITQLLSARADELGVDRIAAAMRRKLEDKRLEGRHGWNNDCSIEQLGEMLREKLEIGDILGVANFAMMIWNRQHPSG